MGNVFNKSSFGAEIKDRKLFAKRDIFIYALLFCLVASLFLFLFIFNVNTSQGFKVEIDGQAVLTHEYGLNFEIDEQYKEKVSITKDGESFLVKITFDGGYNILFVNEKEKSVVMQESDCPSKNCVHMPKISKAGAIYCAPRKLKITPLKDNEINRNPSICVGGQV